MAGHRAMTRSHRGKRLTSQHALKEDALFFLLVASSSATHLAVAVSLHLLCFRNTDPKGLGIQACELGLTTSLLTRRHRHHFVGGEGEDMEWD